MIPRWKCALLNRQIVIFAAFLHVFPRSAISSDDEDAELDEDDLDLDDAPKKSKSKSKAKAAGKIELQ